MQTKRIKPFYGRKTIYYKKRPIWLCSFSSNHSSFYSLRRNRILIFSGPVNQQLWKLLFRQILEYFIQDVCPLLQEKTNDLFSWYLFIYPALVVNHLKNTRLCPVFTRSSVATSCVQLLPEWHSWSMISTLATLYPTQFKNCTNRHLFVTQISQIIYHLISE